MKPWKYRCLLPDSYKKENRKGVKKREYEKISKGNADEYVSDNAAYSCF